MKLPPFLLVLGAAGAMVLPEAGAQSVEALEITRQSEYQAPGGRNPFWPIGWAPADPAAVVTAPATPTQDLDLSFFTPTRFSLTSISIGRLPLALINGRTYSEGDLVPITPQYQAEVVDIRDGEVDLRFRTKTITVPLKSQAPRGRR